MLTEDQFETLYQPIDSPSDGGCSGWTWEEVQFHDPRHVWTVVEGDRPGWLYAMPGFHVVNVIYYLVTEKPWETGYEQAVWCEPSAEALLYQIAQVLHEDEVPSAWDSAETKLTAIRKLFQGTAYEEIPCEKK